jgi:F-type H+-transporting ATPase subunit epsilon
MFKLTVVTPERKLLVDVEVDEVTVPGYAGELNILPGHAPLITILLTGMMKWKVPGHERQFVAVVSGGYCQVSPQGVNVLANTIDLPEEIDVQKATETLLNADKKVLSENLDEVESAELQAIVGRARVSLEVAQIPKH